MAHDEVTRTAAQAADRFGELLRRIVAEWDKLCDGEDDTIGACP
ncbi:MAG: hypothetical protein ACOYJY_06235 [Acutalibacteraceae bacterium]|jgi:hypothetical protein